MAQADAIAVLLACDPDDVMFGWHGVSRSPSQADTVIELLRRAFER